MNLVFQFLYDPAAIGDSKASWSIGVLIIVTLGFNLAAMVFGWNYRRKVVLSWMGFLAFLTFPVALGLFFHSQALAFHKAFPSIDNVWSGYLWFPIYFSSMIFLIGLSIGTGIVKVGGKLRGAQPCGQADAGTGGQRGLP